MGIDLYGGWVRYDDVKQFIEKFREAIERVHMAGQADAYTTVSS